MKCIECAANLTERPKTYVANLDDCVIIIKNVPTLVCDACGELYYSDEVFARIEAIVNALRAVISDVAVVDYTKAA